jgi:hypothetical protein
VRFIRRSLILIHRYLGIALSLVFLIWFVSGIAMIYARGMPTLTPEKRLERLPNLDLAKIHLTPAEALKAANLGSPPEEVQLLTIANRPAYRFRGNGVVIVYADTGEMLEMNAERASEVAQALLGLPASQLHADGVLTELDQWTIGERSKLPLHKFVAEDSAGTVVYVSETTGEVEVMTTRSGRMFAWVAAIPHWMYFRALRTRPQAWRQTVLWLSGAGTVAALIGLVLAVIQYRRRAPHVPYAGWLRWHYITGMIFGVFTLTWVFSGFLSMEPWFWASDGGLGAGVAESLQGASLDLSRFPVPFPSIDGAREIEYLMIQGAPYYQVQTISPQPVLVSAISMERPDGLFSTESLLERVKAANPEVRVLDTTLLNDYDSYYYSFDRQAPLPVVRIKFDDPDSTWLYIDPRMSRLVGRAHRRERLQRWIYHGLHSLDFSFLYYSRPAWDIVMVGLCLGGVTLSSIGVLIAWKRVARAVVRRR